jgi:transposase
VTLHEAQYVVSVVKRAQAHNYAKSLPRRAKMDVLDAPVLAQEAAERKPSPWTPPPTIYHELRQRLMARDALVEMRQQARRERHALLQWPAVIESVREHLDGVIADLDGRLAELEAEIAQALADGAWAESAALLGSITGIGLITTAWLLVGTKNKRPAPRPRRPAPMRMALRPSPTRADWRPFRQMSDASRPP